jgi:hypothetical protein
MRREEPATMCRKTPAGRVDARRLVSRYETMSSNTLRRQNVADTTAEPTVTDRLPVGADRLGIDSEGRIHYWDRAGEQVLVVEPTADLEARIETIAVAPGAEFRGYLNHARDVCGFDSLAFSEDGIAAVLGGEA